MKSRNGLGLDRREFYLRMVQERRANGSVEVASFPSFLFPLVVFYFMCRGMLCFSGVAVKVVSTCFSFYFGLKCTWFCYLSSQELLMIIMQVYSNLWYILTRREINLF